jgi:CheY-like chemotaxis protein
LGTQGQYDLGGLSFLLVEDNRHMSRIIRSILNSLGVKNIIEAEDTTAGLKFAREADVDMILCSWVMNVIDGPAFVQMIRCDENSRNPYVPIIILSAFTEIFRITEARDAGVNEFLAKPLSPKSLYQRIVTIIEKPRPFVRTGDFFGPCRRRQRLGPPNGCAERRLADPTLVTDKFEKLQDVTQR